MSGYEKTENDFVLKKAYVQYCAIPYRYLPLTLILVATLCPTYRYIELARQSGIDYAASSEADLCRNPTRYCPIENPLKRDKQKESSLFLSYRPLHVVLNSFFRFKLT